MIQEREITLRNGEAVDTNTVPVLDIVELRDLALSSVAGGARIAALFGHKLQSGYTKLVLVLAHDAKRCISAASAIVNNAYSSFTPDCPEAHLFEREICEQCAVTPEGHPWLKPVRRHFSLEPRASEGGGNAHSDARHDCDFFSMHGDEVHEVAVGPVHAGVIEPGHFRFQCHGETIHHLEIHLGYQHRGVEEALVGGPHRRTLFQMEAVAGDTTIGHATAYVQCLEALGGAIVPARAQALRALALELERLANHVGDISALSNDVGFLSTAAYCGRLRGDLLNMTATVCGSRFGRGLVRPGGVAFDLDDGLAAKLLEMLDRAGRDLKGAVALFFDTESVRGRMESTGVLSAETCRSLGIVGVAARAAGVSRDCRVYQPAGWYGQHIVSVSLAGGGDVLARATVRRDEIEQSIALVRNLLQNLPRGEISVDCPPLSGNRLAVSLVEGWRGEIAHVAITDEFGRFARYKVVDPSFHNWAGLALALRGQQISDFPLCNKSFNLSYCGFDL